MPLTMADGRRKLTAVIVDPTADPNDPSAIAATVPNGGEDLQCKVLKSDFRLSPTASDTVADTPLCATGNAVVFGSSNYEGSMTPFIYFDEDGELETAENEVWEMVRQKGAHIWIFDRIGKLESEEWAAGDVYRLWHVVTDEPQDPSDQGGYLKRVVPLGVQRLYHGTISS